MTSSNKMVDTKNNSLKEKCFNTRKKETLKTIRIKRIAGKTGMPEKTIKADMDKAKRELGIKNKDYEAYELYLVPHELQLETYLQAKSVALEEQKEKNIQKLMALTGWDRETSVEKLKEAAERTGCTYKEYVIYRFDKMTREQQDEIFNMSHSKKIRKKYDVNREFASIVLNKSDANKYFADFLKRAWCVNADVTKDEFVKIFKNSKKIIYKPIAGHRGEGVESFDLTKDSLDNIYEKLKGYEEGVVEEYVVQHEDLNELVSSSVNTIRIVTISSKTEPVTEDGKFLDIPYAALRIGGGTSVVDNFHSGGMVAGINLDTAELETNAVDMEGNIFEVHPTTGKKIKGFKVPMFNEAIELVRKAAELDYVEGYIGWDIAISENGPLIIEVNTMPGVVLLTAPYAAEQKGKLNIMKKYFE